MSDRPEHPFDQPWQARAFALVVSLSELGLFTWPEWTAALANEIADDPTRGYYDSWLAALEKLVVTRTDVSKTDCEDATNAWLAAAARTAHGEPITLA